MSRSIRYGSYETENGRYTVYDSYEPTAWIEMDSDFVENLEEKV